MREKSIKLTDYFQLISTKQQLSYYKIIPHQNTRNYKSVEISKVINKCYKDITKRILYLHLLTYGYNILS